MNSTVASHGCSTSLSAKLTTYSLDMTLRPIPMLHFCNFIQIPPCLEFEYDILQLLHSNEDNCEVSCYM